MKLYNAIAIFDVYVVAESSEDARNALLAHINSGMQPNEIVGVEATKAHTIRASWIDEKPLVGEQVSDEGFKKLKGKTTGEAFELIYIKPPPTDG
jgi:hypothetical protein